VAECLAILADPEYMAVVKEKIGLINSFQPAAELAIAVREH
jgi:hypothetical protein